MVKRIVQLVLLLIIVALVFLIYRSIETPIRFSNEKKAREQVIIQRLKQIRMIQELYNKMNNRYIPTWDSLVLFLKQGKVPLLKITPRPGDTLLINPIIDTIGYVSVIDTLFKNQSIDIEKLRYIPFSDINGAKPDTFTMKTDRIKKGEIMVSVIEVVAPFKSFLKDYDLKKFNVNPDEGLRFGSLTEPTVDGNWE
ncbi:MAG: hypothetical protein N2Z72_05625 [Bacteroidales bacterium]|nr:hypothetical protein [Bacteroidales bacterium]